MVNKLIENYSFGEIIIDGERFTDDVILLGENIETGWWRDRGHSVNLDDLKKVIRYDPDILIIGTGHTGNMSVPRSLVDELDFEVKKFRTKKACGKYNELIKGPKKVAGAFHLTC